MFSFELYNTFLQILFQSNPQSMEHQNAKTVLIEAINSASVEELQVIYSGTNPLFLGTSYAFLATNTCQWDIVQALARKNAINHEIMNHPFQMPGAEGVFTTLAFLLITFKAGRKILVQDNFKLTKMISAVNLKSLNPDSLLNTQPLTTLTMHMLDEPFDAVHFIETQIFADGITSGHFVNPPGQEDPELDGIRMLRELARSNIFMTKKVLREIINENDACTDKLLTTDGLILLLLMQRNNRQLSDRELTPTLAIKLLAKVSESQVAKKLFTEDEFRLLKVIDPLWLQSDAEAMKAYCELRREMWTAEDQEYEILPTIPTVTRRAIINSFHLFTESLAAAERAFKTDAPQSEVKAITSFWNRVTNRAY